MPRNGLLIALAAPGTAFLLLFFFLPLSALPVEALSSGANGVRRLLEDSVFWKGLRGTLILGTAAPLFSVVVGFCLSLFLARLGPLPRRCLLILVSLPLTFSGLVIAYGFILVFGRSGFLTLLLSELGADPATVGAFIYSPVGLGFAYSYYLIPRAILVLLPVIVNFDRSQLLAAASLGASEFRAHLDIMVPQIMPAGLSAFCLTAAVAIGAYGTALALVGTQVNILPLLLYSKISETGSDLPTAAALSIVLMAITSAVMVLAEVFGSIGRSHSSDAGNGVMNG